MKEPHAEGRASRGAPEACAGFREGSGEALSGARTGGVLSHEKLGGLALLRRAKALMGAQGMRVVR